MRDEEDRVRDGRFDTHRYQAEGDETAEEDDVRRAKRGVHRQRETMPEVLQVHSRDDEQQQPDQQGKTVRLNPTDRQR